MAKNDGIGREISGGSFLTPLFLCTIISIKSFDILSETTKVTENSDVQLCHVLTTFSLTKGKQREERVI